LGNTETEDTVVSLAWVGELKTSQSFLSNIVLLGNKVIITKTCDNRKLWKRKEDGEVGWYG
jgi:hypothetical protein